MSDKQRARMGRIRERATSRIPGGWWYERDVPFLLRYIAELEGRLKEAREVIREFEWIEHMTEEGYMCMACPSCFRNNMDPDYPVHNDNCKLAATLKKRA